MGLKMQTSLDRVQTFENIVGKRKDSEQSEHIYRVVTH